MANFARCGDGSTEHFAEVSGYCKSQAGSAVFSSCGSICLGEGFEKLPDLGFIHTNPRIADSKGDRVIGALYGECNGTVLRELCRVAQKIKECLSNFGLIAEDRTEVGLAACFELVIPFQEKGLHGFRDFSDQFLDINVFQVEGHSTGFYF